MFSILRPFLFNLDPETAHDLAIKSLKFNPLPSRTFEVENEKMKIYTYASYFCTVVFIEIFEVFSISIYTPIFSPFQTQHLDRLTDYLL